MQFEYKKNRKPFLKQVNVQSVNAMTADGEVYTAEKKIQVVHEDDSSFRMTFCEYAFFVKTSKSLIEVKVFDWIQNQLKYNSTEVVLDKKSKTEMAEFYEMSYSAIEKAIGVLVERELIVRDDRYPRSGRYNVNPSFVWYGDSNTRKGHLKFTLEVIQRNNLPEKEKQTAEDIERYEKWYHSQSEEPEKKKEKGTMSDKEKQEFEQENNIK